MCIAKIFRDQPAYLYLAELIVVQTICTYPKSFCLANSLFRNYESILEFKTKHHIGNTTLNNIIIQLCDVMLLLFTALHQHGPHPSYVVLHWHWNKALHLMIGYTSRGSNSPPFIFACLLKIGLKSWFTVPDLRPHMVFNVKFTFA